MLDFFCSGSNQRVFIAMVRNDIASALNISMDYVSVTELLKTPKAQWPKAASLPRGNTWVTLTFELTSDVSEVRVLRMLLVRARQSQNL